MAFAKCPWCGGEARVEIKEYKHGSRQVGFDFGVKCGACGATKGGRYNLSIELEEDGRIRIARDDMNIAEKDWNTRVIDLGWKDGK